MNERQKKLHRTIAFRICYTIFIMQIFYAASKVDNGQNVQPLLFHLRSYCQSFQSVYAGNEDHSSGGGGGSGEKRVKIKIRTLKRMPKTQTLCLFVHPSTR